MRQGVVAANRRRRATLPPPTDRAPTHLSDRRTRSNKFRVQRGHACLVRPHVAVERNPVELGPDSERRRRQRKLDAAAPQRRREVRGPHAARLHTISQLREQCAVRLFGVRGARPTARCEEHRRKTRESAVPLRALAYVPLRCVPRDLRWI